MHDKDIFGIYGYENEEQTIEEEEKEKAERKLEEELMEEDHKRLASKFRNFDNGKGAWKGEAKTETKAETKDPELELLKEKATEQDIRFVIDTMVKEAKH